MATAPGTPRASRAYRAACTNCGAPVEFASAASASAVCSFCRSTLVRDGDALRRIGVSGELFDDHSPLQLGVGGLRQGLSFTLVGRLQYGYFSDPLTPVLPTSPPEGAVLPGGASSTLGGTWNEWHALFDNERSAWLSEDNGAYVVAFDAPLPADAPDLANLRAGQRVVVDGRGWDVASVQQVHLIAAQGELPSPPRLEGSFTVVDLRNQLGEVGTLDNSDPQHVAWSVGRSVALSELRLTGLKDDVAEKTLSGRGFACPSCGASLTVTLASTKSLSCHQCKAVVDVSQGVGGELAHYAQNNSGEGGAEPQLPLGKTGTLALGGPPLAWQVVGYQERCDIPDSADDETTFWREYLLYERSAGFAFLVDSNDGWSWVRPLTGAPQVRGETAVWDGVSYKRRYSYNAKVTWVRGEFYWRVQRDERAFVSDFEGTGADRSARLSREQTGNEVVWSGGRTLDAATVANAFGVAPSGRAALRRDESALASSVGSGIGFGKAVLIFGVVMLVLIVMSRCGRDDCGGVRQTFGAASTEYQQCQRNRASGGGLRTGGGSYGGWSSGSGGHK